MEPEGEINKYTTIAVDLNTLLGRKIGKGGKKSVRI